MEGEVTGTRTRCHTTRLRLIRGQGALSRIKAVDEDIIRAEVGHVNKTVRHVRINAVGMRTRLAALVRPRTFLLKETTGRAD